MTASNKQQQSYTPNNNNNQRQQTTTNNEQQQYNCEINLTPPSALTCKIETTIYML